MKSTKYASKDAELLMLDAIAYVKEREGVNMDLVESLINQGMGRLDALRMVKASPITAWANANKELKITGDIIVTRTLKLDQLQEDVGVWCDKIGFGRTDLQMRLRRFAEEAAELCQAGGLDFMTFLKVVLDAYSRPVGDAPQEVGGVMITLLALNNVLGINTWAEANREFDRINTPEMIAKIKAKQLDKAAKGI